MLLASAVQTAVVVDDRGRYVGVLTVRRARRRRSARTPEARAGSGRVRPGEPLILWDWTFSHLPDIWLPRGRAPGADRHRRRASASLLAFCLSLAIRQAPIAVRAR